MRHNYQCDKNKLEHIKNILKQGEVNMKDKFKNEKYKVIVWGPGKMGSYAMHYFLTNDAYELVGVKGFAENEIDVDAGEFLGLEPCGVIMTNDDDALLALDADVVLFTRREDPNWGTDAEIVKILESGKNVVTTLPYHNLKAWREPEVAAQIENACLKNNVTFYAGGVDPDIISDRMLLSMAGACSDIKEAIITEVWDVSNGAKPNLQFLGYGKTVEEAKKNEKLFASSVNFQKSVVYTAEEDFGVKFDRVVESHEFHVAEEDITEPWLIEKGTVGRITHHMDCYVNSISEEKPFFRVDLEWYFGPKMLPANANPEDDYILTIEGTPSLQSHVSFKASNYSDEKLISYGNRKLTPNYIVTIMSVLNSIPTIVEAEAGLHPSIRPQVTWMQDMRDSVK